MYIDFRIHFQLLQMLRSIFENGTINGTYLENTGVHFVNINNIFLIQRVIFALLGFREHI